jgi:rhodanese-related sulfurtransferase
MLKRSAMPSVRVKMMDCPGLEKLVINREPIQLIDVRSKNEFAAMHMREHDRSLLPSWQRPISFEDCVQRSYRFVSFLLKGMPRLALPPGC